jgi:hypothetical protein
MSVRVSFGTILRPLAFNFNLHKEIIRSISYVDIIKEIDLGGSGISD